MWWSSQPPNPQHKKTISTTHQEQEKETMAVVVEWGVLCGPTTRLNYHYTSYSAIKYKVLGEYQLGILSRQIFRSYVGLLSAVSLWKHGCGKGFPLRPEKQTQTRLLESGVNIVSSSSITSLHPTLPCYPAHPTAAGLQTDNFDSLEQM